MCSEYSFCFTFRFQALDESFQIASYLCPHCDSSYQSISRLRKHVNTKQTGPLKYMCNTCDQGFAEKHQLEAHLTKHGGDKVMCSLCDKNFTTTFLLRHHIAGAHENVKHQCRTCKAVFIDKDVLKQHVSGYTIRSIDMCASATWLLHSCRLSVTQ